MLPAVRPPAAAPDGSDKASGSDGGEADDRRSVGQQDGTGTPERGENAEGSAAEAPCRRTRVSVRARSEARMVRDDIRGLLLLNKERNYLYSCLLARFFVHVLAKKSFF
jgi:hypothetical protein